MTEINELLDKATDRSVRPVDVERIVRRGKRRKRARVTLVASLGVIAVLGGVLGLNQLSGPVGPEIVDHPDGERVLNDLGVPVLIGSELYGVPGAPHRLVRPAEVRGVTGNDVKLSPDGTAVAYTSTDLVGRQLGDEVTPSVRVLDLETGSDRVVVEGASTVAWRDDRSIATVVGGSVEHGDPNYLGQVAVVDITTGQRESWVQEPAGYYVAAWADDRLIVIREDLGPEGAVDQATLVMDGPGQARPIGESGRNQVIDVAPDGQHVLLRWSPPQGGTLGEIHLVNLASGHVVARLAPITVDNRIGSTGDWHGDRVVIGSDKGRAVVLRVSSGSIELERTIDLLPGVDIEPGPYAVAYTDDGILAVVGQTSFEGPAPEFTTTIIRCQDGTCEQIGVRADSVHLIRTSNRSVQP